MTNKKLDTKRNDAIKAIKNTDNFILYTERDKSTIDVKTVLTEVDSQAILSFLYSQMNEMITLMELVSGHIETNVTEESIKEL